MKCLKCQTENRDNQKTCKKCGSDMHQIEIWQPTWKWHFRVLAVIYGGLIVLFILLNIILKPYMRKIPVQITPWLEEMTKTETKG